MDILESRFKDLKLCMEKMALENTVGRMLLQCVERQLCVSNTWVYEKRENDHI